ncbi:MAG: ABC transporter ATP-binding protein [Thermoanaerobaculia bacterium]|nr:ABC transporter ATP-binding protein [Thermoanaerobaculia bacterium]
MHPSLAASMRGVWFAYPARSPCLQNVDLEIESDDLLGIVGPNGSGKTTLLRLLLGLLEPTQGTVEVFGRPSRQVRTRIGYVPQHAYVDLSVPATALDVVLMGRLHRSPWGLRFGRKHRNHALEAMRRVGVEDLARRPLGEMSGGQRQRTLIARALAGEAELLILDEPTTGVDFHAEQELMDLLLKLNRDIPIVMVSHDVSLVSAHFKRVACVSRSVTIHPTQELTPERLAGLYGGATALVDHSRSEEQAL